MKSLFTAARKKQIVINSIKVALFVGTLLNLINQGKEIWLGLDISWGHVALNYLVPYCVATYSAAKNEIAKPE
jgi:hypothetical protein